MVWHGVWRRPRYFGRGITVEHRQLLARVEVPVLATNQRLGEEHGIVDHSDHGEKLTVARPVFGHCSLVAAGNAVTTEVVRLEMRGRDGEHVAFPDTRREALKGVFGVLGWMGAPVEPDHPVPAPSRHVCVKRNKSLVAWIEVPPHTQVA